MAIEILVAFVIGIVPNMSALFRPPIVFYLIPFAPLLTRGIIFVRYFNVRREVLSEAQMGRESARNVILAMAGFSFTGVIGIAVIERSSLKMFEIPVFYLLVSFLCYLLALNIQDYKFYLSREQLSLTLIDIATLSLISTTVAVVFISGYGTEFKIAVTIIAASSWLIDHLFHLGYSWKVFKSFGGKDDNGGRRNHGACY